MYNTTSSLLSVFIPAKRKKWTVNFEALNYGNIMSIIRHPEDCAKSLALHNNYLSSVLAHGLVYDLRQRLIEDFGIEKPISETVTLLDAS
ncbi:hypothetical protein [Escherichia coli]|uniref:hypothetical protein n=1 Tax=Escherichia coli TaxID=562 RepID=UPI0017F17B0F|nr:hypothetical protein [Escherichia coli]EFM6520587.1 hypothetical protein [Escherichia coli]EIV9095606.1 hypothetical protein [Escherichia coli]HCL9682003.1 hypothetical protein [Escherichia coli]